MAEGLRDRAWRAFTPPLVICTPGRSQAGRFKLLKRRGISPQHAPGSTAASGQAEFPRSLPPQQRQLGYTYLAVCHSRERAELGAGAGPLAAVLRRALRHQRVRPEKV